MNRRVSSYCWNIALPPPPPHILYLTLKFGSPIKYFSPMYFRVSCKVILNGRKLKACQFYTLNVPELEQYFRNGCYMYLSLQGKTDLVMFNLCVFITCHAIINIAKQYRSHWSVIQWAQCEQVIFKNNPNKLFFVPMSYIFLLSIAPVLHQYYSFLH